MSLNELGPYGLEGHYLNHRMQKIDFLGLYIMSCKLTIDYFLFLQCTNGCPRRFLWISPLTLYAIILISFRGFTVVVCHLQLQYCQPLSASWHPGLPRKYCKYDFDLALSAQLRGAFLYCPPWTFTSVLHTGIDCINCVFLKSSEDDHGCRHTLHQGEYSNEGCHPAFPNI